VWLHISSRNGEVLNDFTDAVCDSEPCFVSILPGGYDFAIGGQKLENCKRGISQIGGAQYLSSARLLFVLVQLCTCCMLVEKASLEALIDIRRGRCRLASEQGDGFMARVKKQSPGQPLLLTVPEVADSLRVCRRTVYTLMASEGLPWVLVGGSRRVRLDSLHVWLKEHEQQGA
jgi:excisionase family DNA binding protein